MPKKIVARVLERTDLLRSDPYPRGTVKLEGAERLYRIRIGDYRVVYEVDTDARLIIIEYLRHRSDVYRNL